MTVYKIDDYKSQQNIKIYILLFRQHIFFPMKLLKIEYEVKCRVLILYAA